MQTTIQLTKEQKRIIEFDEGALLVQAGPGSGKTAVLTQRIIRLLRKSSGQNFRILALTFTTKAADNMRHRVEIEIGDEWRRTMICTFHAFCLDVLWHYGEHIGVSQPLTVYEQEEDRLALLAKAIIEEGLATKNEKIDDRRLANILHEIGKRKKEIIPPEAIAERNQDDVFFKAAYSGYNRQLELHHGVDFDDLLVLTYKLFTESPRVASHYRRIYRYILVDEAQDTNRAQYQLLKALCGEEHRNLMMVADADQYIYRFAGASDKYLTQFQKDFKAESFPLSINFRSTPDIVQIANQLINHSRRLDGAPTMASTLSGKASIIEFHEEENEFSEAEWIFNRLIEIEKKLKRENSNQKENSFSQIAVLARNRFILEPIRSVLDKNKIPYHFSTSKEGLFATEQAKIFHLFLQILHNPYDLIHREILLTALGIDSQNLQVFESSKLLFKQIQESSSLKPCWGNFIQSLLDLVRDANRISEYYEALLKAFQQQIFPCEDDAASDELLQRDLQLLKERYQDYTHTHSSEEQDLESFLGELALSGTSGMEGRGVQVLTLHAAKGLEFDAVFIVGMNEGIFPDYRSLKTPGGIDEERRNAYVAITRAKKILYLTRSRFRQMPWGENKMQKPSVFLREMGLIN